MRDGWRFIEVWYEGGTDEDYERMFDDVLHAAHDAKPDGVDIHVGGTYNAKTPGWAMEAEIERLREELEAAQLRSIEARNPGIDMDEVRAIRAGNREA